MVQLCYGVYIIINKTVMHHHDKKQERSITTKYNVDLNIMDVLIYVEAKQGFH